MTLTEPQKLLTQLIESSIEEEIDAIGTPREVANGQIEVAFQYGSSTYTAKIDPDKGTMTY